VPTAPQAGARHAAAGGRPIVPGKASKEISMPVILWLLGVPLTIILLLMLFGVL
jgi:hypothetical protein